MAPSACYPERASEVNSVLEVLTNDHRREVVYYFERVLEPDTASVSDIVSHLDAETPGTDPERARIRLVHTHLPKLDEGGWIEYDRRTETVRYHGHDGVRRHLADLLEIFE